jgi:hypothetical protein
MVMQGGNERKEWQPTARSFKRELLKGASDPQSSAVEIRPLAHETTDELEARTWRGNGPLIGPSHVFIDSSSTCERPK